jgi:hypothetical protein
MNIHQVAHSGLLEIVNNSLKYFGGFVEGKMRIDSDEQHGRLKEKNAVDNKKRRCQRTGSDIPLSRGISSGSTSCFCGSAQQTL